MVSLGFCMKTKDGEKPLDRKTRRKVEKLMKEMVKEGKLREIDGMKVEGKRCYEWVSK